MDTLQFSLFFAALLIGYALVHLRLVRFEAYLKEIVGLKQLNDRLKGVAEAMERVKVDRLEEGLQLLHEDASQLMGLVSKLERGLGQQGRREGDVRAGEISAPERVLATVEQRLFHLGYQNLHVLTDLRHVKIEDEVDVQVECDKNLMPHKGRLTVHNGSIQDMELQAVVRTFP